MSLSDMADTPEGDRIAALEAAAGYNPDRGADGDATVDGVAEALHELGGMTPALRTAGGRR